MVVGSREGRGGRAGLGALRVGLRAAGVVRGDGGGAGAHGRVAGDRRAGPGGEVGAVGGEVGGDRAGALAQCTGEQGDLGGLLPGEGEPAGDLRIDVAFQGGVDRHVQQGAGRCDVDAVGEAEQGRQGGERLLQVVDPDVAAVDDARDQPLARQAADGGEVVQVGGGGAGEVQGQALDGCLGEHRQGLAEAVEIACDQQLRPVGEGAELAVGASGGVQFGRGAVLDEGGLIQLRPVGAGGLQCGEQLRVDRQQPVQQGDRLEVRRHSGGGLGQQQVGDRADQHRPGPVAERERLGEFADRLGGVRHEDRVGSQLGDQVVVVGVEPLGHLQRRDVLGAARHGEVPVERVGVDGGPVAGRDRTDGDRGVEHVVVQREVTGGDFEHPGVGELPPVLPAQLGGGGLEGVGGDGALPVPLDRLLELPVPALAG